MEVNVKHYKGRCLTEPSLYHQLVDSLNYLTITSPNLAFVGQQVSQFMQSPSAFGCCSTNN